MAVDPVQDKDLVVLPADHLFESSITHIGFRKGTFLRKFMYDFIRRFAPHLTRDKVNEAVAAPTRAERNQIFEQVDLPSR